MKLREMLGQTAEEVERISRDLRPSVLDELGLVAVLRDTCAEFAERTGVSVKLACVPLTARLPADTELALYRILQEALKNVEQHARARHVTVRLTQQGDFVQLTITGRRDRLRPGSSPGQTKRKGRPWSAQHARASDLRGRHAQGQIRPGPWHDNPRRTFRWSTQRGGER